VRGDDEWNNYYQQHCSGRKTVTEIVSMDDVDPDATWVADGGLESLLAALPVEDIGIVREATTHLLDKQAKVVTSV